MDLVDDINLVGRLTRRIAHLVPQVTDFLDPVVGGRVNLNDVAQLAGRNGLAKFTLVAGIAICLMWAVDCLGQNFGCRGLPCSPWPGEQIGVA